MAQLIKRSDAIRELGVPVAYYPRLARVIGVEECVFFCQLLYWTTDGRTRDEEGWVYKQSDEWQEETGLNYKRQLTARKSLKRLGILEEKEERLKHRLYFRINWERYDEVLDESEIRNFDKISEKKEDDSDRDLGKSQTGISRNAESGFPEMPNRDFGNTQIGIPYIDRDYKQRLQAETTSRKRTPKPPCRGKGAFSFSDDKKDRVKKNASTTSRPDWSIRPEEGDDAAFIASLFPRCPQDWPDPLARKYVKRRQDGSLTNRVLALIKSHYRDCPDSYDYAETPDRRWKAKTLSEFLSRKNLETCCAALRDCVQIELQSVQNRLEACESTDYARMRLTGIERTLRADPESLEMLIASNPASTLLCVAQKPGQYDQEQRKYREAILREIREHVSIFRMAKDAGRDFNKLLGITEDELQKEVDDTVLGYQTKIRHLKELLN